MNMGIRTTEIKCLRCGEPYPVNSVTKVVEYDQHTCSFDKEKENNPFESGVVGNLEVTTQTLEYFLENYEVIIAGAYNNLGSKRITLNTRGRFRVYENNELIHQGITPFIASKRYNDIKLPNYGNRKTNTLGD